MIRDVLLRVMQEYPSARESSFEKHPLAGFITREAPTILRTALTLPPEFSVVGSAGKGNWVAGPWIAVLDSLVTESAPQTFEEFLALYRKTGQ